jgi:hypothetical protein
MVLPARLSGTSKAAWHPGQVIGMAMRVLDTAESRRRRVLPRAEGEPVVKRRNPTWGLADSHPTDYRVVAKTATTF